MAEAFGVAAGISGIIGLIVQVTQVVVQFGLDWKNAPTDIQNFRSELRSLKTVLSEMYMNLLQNPNFEEAFQNERSALLSELKSNAASAMETKVSIESCKNELEIMLDGLRKRGKGHRIGWDRLKSLFFATEIQKSIDRLHRHCQVLNNILSMDTATLVTVAHREIRQARTEQKEWHSTHENQKILTWLSDLSFEEKQRDILSKRHPGTGQWLLSHERYETWRDSGNECSTLWCPGIPGAGKTVMTSIVIENLQQMFAEEDVSISFAYCDYKDRKNQTTLNLVSSLVKQLVLQQKDMPTEIMELYLKTNHGQSSLSLRDQLSLLSCFSKFFRKSFVLVDALDENFTNEVEEDTLQSALLDELLKLQERGKGSARYTLFFTSRENHVIRKRLAGALRLDICAKNEDIETYIRSRIRDPTKFPFADKLQRDTDLTDSIIGQLTEKAQGMFLLPRLHLDRLGCQTSVRSLRKTLEYLPTKLNETYDEAIARIQGQVPEHCQLALSALSWISNALRPLRVDEIQHALAVQIGDHALDEEAIPDEEVVISVSAGLITVDAESETIRLVHFTVEEYFKGTKHKWFPDAETRIAETCLTYLSFDIFESGRCSFREEMYARLENNCLLDYANQNWFYHACTAEVVPDLALDFLMDDRKVSCFVEIMPIYVYDNIPGQFYGMHLTAYLGLTALTKRLLESNIMVDPKDDSGRTPLSYAAERGYEALVKLLLDRNDVAADSQDQGGRTPLWWAVQSGHEAVIKLLLDRKDVVADSQDQYGRAPLDCAIEGENLAAVKLLLDRGVAADFPDQKGMTPLSYAALTGGEAIVKLLLGRNDVMTNSRDKGGRTPLSYAALTGSEAVVKLLLGRNDVMANSQDQEGRTPLSYAALIGGEAVVKLLLGRNDVMANSQDQEGRTPLSYAALTGGEAVVKLLLGRNDVVADSRDKGGRTPLSYAAWYGYEAVVKLLPGRIDMIANSQDQEGRTSLSYAAANFDVATAKLLLDHGVAPDTKDNEGRTPLSYAASNEYGSVEVVQLLLSRDDVAADTKDNEGRTPLSYAASNRYVKVVALLLSRDDVAAESQDKDGRTPLWYAVKRGNERMASLLRKKMGIVNAEGPDRE